MTLTEGNYQGDWLKDEFGPPNHSREEITVLATEDLASGTVLGVESTFSKKAPYDNSDPAAATGILLNAVTVNDAVAVTSITDSSNTSTIVFPVPHGLIAGDIIKISGGTVDTDINSNRAVATVPDATSVTCASSSLTDAAYTETTLRVTKLNHPAVAVVRGPVVVCKAGLDWGNSDGTGVTAGLADLLTLGIVAREGV